MIYYIKQLLIMSVAKGMKQVQEIKRILIAAGNRFIGCSADETAEEWTEANFTPSEVAEWVGVGVWNPDVAFTAEMFGFTPETFLEAVVEMAAEKGLTPADVTDAVCNYDILTEELV